MNNRLFYLIFMLFISMNSGISVSAQEVQEVDFCAPVTSNAFASPNPWVDGQIAIQFFSPNNGTSLALWQDGESPRLIYSPNQLTRMEDGGQFDGIYQDGFFTVGPELEWLSPTNILTVIDVNRQVALHPHQYNYWSQGSQTLGHYYEWQNYQREQWLVDINIETGEFVLVTQGRDPAFNKTNILAFSRPSASELYGFDIWYRNLDTGVEDLLSNNSDFPTAIKWGDAEINPSSIGLFDLEFRSPEMLTGTLNFGGSVNNATIIEIGHHELIELVPMEENTDAHGYTVSIGSIGAWVGNHAFAPNGGDFVYFRQEVGSETAQIWVNISGESMLLVDGNVRGKPSFIDEKTVLYTQLIEGGESPQYQIFDIDIDSLVVDQVTCN